MVRFVAEKAPEGGFIARALDYAIFTEADDWDELQEAVQEAAYCHFGKEENLCVLCVLSERL